MKAILKNLQHSGTATKVTLATFLLLAMSSANAAITLPGGGLFCDLAQALRSQWAPGIFMLILVFEGILYYFSPKGAISKILVFVVAAGVVFGAATYLGYIGVPQTCGG